MNSELSYCYLPKICHQLHFKHITITITPNQSARAFNHLSVHEKSQIASNIIQVTHPYTKKYLYVAFFLFSSAPSLFRFFPYILLSFIILTFNSTVHRALLNAVTIPSFILN